MLCVGSRLSGLRACSLCFEKVLWILLRFLSVASLRFRCRRFPPSFTYDINDFHCFSVHTHIIFQSSFSSSS